MKLSPLDIVEVTKTLNSRIRGSGLASREILLSRSLITNAMLDLTSRNLSEEKYEARVKKNDFSHAQQSAAGLKVEDANIQEGDLVFIRESGSKHQPRAQFIVHRVLDDKDTVLIRKSQDQLQANKYKVKQSQLIKIPFYRGPPAGMPENELERKCAHNSENSTQSPEIEKSPVIKQKRGQKVLNPKVHEPVNKDLSIPAGKGEGAPVSLNNAGRPRRRAAIVSPDAYLSNIVHFLDDSYAKPPWLPQDQPDEEFGVPAGGGQRPAPEHPHQLHHPQEAGQDQLGSKGVTRELPHLPGDTHNVITDTAIRGLDVANVNELQSPTMPITHAESVENVSKVSDHNTSATSDGSCYRELSLVRQRHDSDYYWDEQQEQPSFLNSETDQDQEDTEQVNHSLGHWPPRHLSSEYNAQMEVSLVPGSTETGPQYFDDDAFLNFEADNRLITNASQDLSLAPGLASLAPLNINRGEGPLSPVSSTHSEELHHETSDRLSSNVDVSENREPSAPTFNSKTSQDADKRSSSRLQSKARVDYRHLDSKGKPDQH